MRRIVIPVPGSGGQVTDAAAHTLGLEHAVLISNGVLEDGMLKQRRGWSYHLNTTGVVRISAARVRFVLADAIDPNTISIVDDSTHYSLEVDGSSVSLGTGQPRMWPRCVYNDELLFCAEDGYTPMMRYSGGNLTTTTTSVGSFNGSEPILRSSPTPLLSTPTAQFASWTPKVAGSGSAPVWPRMYFRVTRGSTTQHTLESATASLAFSSLAAEVGAVGYTYPCIPLPSTGVVQSDGTTITGIGTDLTLVSPDFGNGAIIIRPEGAQAEHVPMLSTATTTSVSTLSTNFSTDKMPYTLTARCPWTDAQVHRGSLWGLGNKHYPNRVYVAPPGWRAGIPPGFAGVDSVDVADTSQTYDPSEFALFPIDVPAPGDDDPAVALVSTEGPLLVAKRNSVHRIDGAYPNFTQRVVARGVGCSNPRARVSADQGGPFWADERGVYTWDGAGVRDITQNRISDEYRSYTSNYPDIVLGVWDGKLIVSLTRSSVDETGAGPVWHYDISRGVWLGRLTNTSACFMWLDREGEQLLACRVAGGTYDPDIINLASMYDPELTPIDGDGTYPAFTYTSGSGITATRDGVDTEKVLADVRPTVLHYDVSVGDASTVGLTVTYRGDAGSDETVSDTLVAVGALNDADARVLDSTVNAHGRQHQLTITRTGTLTATTDFGLSQIVLDVIDSSAGT